MAAAAAVAGGLTFFTVRAQTPPAQTFRTGTDVVVVNVTVRDGGRMVTTRGAEDFIVTDNGVRQQVESIEAAAVPIDLTLVVDVSGTPLRSWSARVDAARVAAAVQSEFDEVKALLRPDDRVRLFAIDTNVQQLTPMRQMPAAAALPPLEVDGMSALFDTLAAALIQPVEPARRHVVVARTKGIDTISSIDAEAVRVIAGQSDALLHIVVMEDAIDSDAALSGFQCQLMGLCRPTRAFWIPFQRRLTYAAGGSGKRTSDGEEVADGADATGGALHQAGALTVPTLTGTFRRAFEDFRNSYVLRYTPKGVAAPGWHAIEVRVAGNRSYRVSARKGYLVETPRQPLPPPPLPELPQTLAQMIAAYDRGAYRPVILGVRQARDPARLLREFTEAGNPWPAVPRKEATFALELVEPALFSSREATREAAQALLHRFSVLIRHPFEPDVFEQYWYFAALTLLEGSLRPAATEALADRARERFPDEPRFALSRAIAIDQRWATRSLSAVVDAAGKPTAAHVDDVRRAYSGAMASPETAGEARIRLGWFLHRAGFDEEARTHLVHPQSAAAGEPALRYLRQLFLGHVLWALGQHDGAITAHRDALAIVPGAQSARVALMNASLLRGDREAAESYGEQIQTDTSDAIDPWWMYWQGQYRLHPQAIARVRELSR
jgi:VWFA-related protein